MCDFFMNVFILICIHTKNASSIYYFIQFYIPVAFVMSDEEIEDGMLSGMFNALHLSKFVSI